MCDSDHYSINVAEVTKEHPLGQHFMRVNAGFSEVHAKRVRQELRERFPAPDWIQGKSTGGLSRASRRRS